MHFVVLLSALVACAAAVPLSSTEPRVGARIIGGYNASDATHVVSLRDKNHSFVCAGVIIDKDWVLTAAHCVVGQYVVRLRAGSLSNKVGGRIHHLDTNYTYPHDHYIYPNPDYDIALLKVKKPFGCDNESAGPITLEDNEVNPGTHAFVTGWGATSVGGSTSEILQQLKVQILSEEDCKKDWPAVYTPRTICAKSPNNNSGACHGDSGGPLIANGKLVGIVSIGDINCAKGGYPDVYVKISAMHDWINNITGLHL